MQHNSQTHLQVVEALPTISRAAGTYTSASYLDTTGFSEAIVILTAGTHTTGTTDVKLRSATDSSGTGVADVPGASFTQITSANDEKLFIGRIKLTPVTAGTNQAGNTSKPNPFLQVSSTVATAAGIYGVTILLVGPVAPNVMGTTLSRDLASPTPNLATSYAFNVD
jgi:hypothetical protein